MISMNLNAFAQALLPVAIYKRLSASDIGKRLARGSFWAMVNALVTKGASFVQAILLARILGITVYGEWGILLSTSAMVGVFACFGLATTTTKHVAQWRFSETERLGRLLSLLQISAMGMGLLACLILVAAAEPIAQHILVAPQLAGPLVYIGFIVLLSALSGVYSGILNGLERFRDSSIINGISIVTGVILTVLLSIVMGLEGAIFGLLLTSLLTAGGFALWSIRALSRLGIHLRVSDSWKEWRQIRDFALPTVLAGAIVMAAMWAAQVALVRQPDGYASMGAYQAANQWRTIVVFLPTQLMAAYLPVMASLVTIDRVRLRQMQSRTLASMMSLALILALPVIFLSPWLMQLYGSDFAGFWPILVIVALIPVFDIGHVVLQNTAIAHGYAWTLLLSNLSMVTAVTIGIIWLIPVYLGLGLAMTLLLGYSSRVLAEYVIYRRRQATN